jgi:predicted ATPase
MDFTKCLYQIECTGKKLYHPTFKVFAEDYEIIFKLLIYFLNDTVDAEKYNISFRKGILLSGPVGCGKTSLMFILRLFQQPEERLILKPCRDISFEFIQEGYSTIQKYSKHSFKNEVPKA